MKSRTQGRAPAGMVVANIVAKGPAPRARTAPRRPAGSCSDGTEPSREALSQAKRALAAAALGPGRTPRPHRGADQQRLAELKAKLVDDDYMNGAILRIATVLSARLTLK